MATIHDIVMTIGFFVVSGIEFNQSSIAAILTIVGYSLNDTVVVYDRVREDLRRYKKMPLPQLLNNAINETLSRTTLTSVTTMLALLALFIFGGEVIRSFTAAMLFGVVFGTYSSIFIAAPLLILFRLRPGQREPRKRKPAPAGKALATIGASGRRHRHARGALPRTCADRGLWQWRLPLRRHVASRLAALPAVRHLWLGAEGPLALDGRGFCSRLCRGGRDRDPAGRQRQGFAADPETAAGRRCARRGFRPIRCRQVRRCAPSTCCSPRIAPSPLR